MKHAKKLLALLVALAMVFALVACSSSDDSSSSSDEAEAEAEEVEGAEEEEAEEPEEAEEAEPEEAEEPADEDEYKVFIVGGDENSTTFNLYDEMDGRSSGVLVRAVCETLWDVDEDGNYTPRLASYAYNDDYTEITITAQEGVVFSNGAALDSEDILYTLTLLSQSQRVADMVGCLDLENAVIVDNLTLTIPLFNYDAGFIAFMSMPNYSVVDKDTHEADPDWTWVVGTGPYVLEEWNEAVNYRLVRNENYRGEPGYYDEIDIRFYSEESTRYADFESGKLDAVLLSESSYINNLSESAAVVRVDSAMTNGLGLAVNDDTNGACSDINIRKALAHCIDVPTIVDALSDGMYTVPDSIVGEDCWAYVPGTGVYEYDPEYAAECLAEAGYSVDNPLTLKVYAEYTAFNESLLDAIYSYAAAIGINLDLTNVADFNSILPGLIGGDAEITIGSVSSSGTSLDPACLLQQAGPDADSNTTRVAQGSEMADLFNAAKASHDQDERKELYQEFIQMYHDEYMFIPLYNLSYIYAYSPEHTSMANAIDFGGFLDVRLLTD